MRCIRFDSIGGASGNMLLGALIGLGVDPQALQTILSTLPIEGFALRVKEARQCGQVGVHVEVEVADEPHPHRGLREIRALIAQGDLSEQTAALARATFERLAVAEASVHGTTPEDVHFHEVGAMDAIVDIVGACACLELLEIEGVHCSALPVGCGTVTAAHGVLPLPVPATAHLLQGTPIVPTDLPYELVTPTGAALLTTWLQELPACSGKGGALRGVGTGFGTRTLPDRPNALRALLFEATPDPEPADADESCRVLECNLDDMTPELIGGLVERLRHAGALDVFTTPVQMKKQRPGVLLTLLCHDAQCGALLDLIFMESTTFGVRDYTVQRHTLAREQVPVETPFGPVRIKVGRWKGRVVTQAPEYEDCAAAAAAHGVAVSRVYEAAITHIEPTTPAPGGAGKRLAEGDRA